MSGLVGSAAVYWLSAPNSITIGASGAIFGLMGALLVVAVKVKGDVQSLLTLVAINVVITVLGSSFISWQGHLGGFVGGLVIGAVLVYAPRERRTAVAGRRPDRRRPRHPRRDRAAHPSPDLTAAASPDR